MPLSEQHSIVLELLSSGLREDEIVRVLVKRHAEGKIDWQPTVELVRQLVTETKPAIAAAAVVDAEFERGRAVLRLQTLYARSMGIQDYKTCLAIQKELNALLRIDEVSGPRKWNP
jgi:hypothetical protein